MSEGQPYAKTESAWVRLVVPALISTVLGIVSAWGTAQYVSGQREQRILTLEYRQKEMEGRLEQAVTRQELKLFMDNASTTLAEIRADIRELRNQNQGKR